MVDNNLFRFNYFGKDGFAEGILNSLRESNNRLLSDPFKDKSCIEFFEKTYDTSKTLLAEITKFKEKLPILDNDPVGYEEQFHKLMQIILFKTDSMVFFECNGLRLFLSPPEKEGLSKEIVLLMNRILYRKWDK